MLVACAAAVLSVRATLLHAILSRTAVPATVPLLAQAVVLTMLPCFTMCAARVHPGLLRGTPALLLGARGLLSGLMVYLNILALQNVAVGVALTLFATSPAFATALSFVFLGYRVRVAEAAALAVNLAGVYLVASPSMSTPQQTVVHAALPAKHIAPAFGVFAALTTAFLIASNFTLVKAMGSRVHYSLNVWAVGVGCAVAFLLVMDHQTLSYIPNFPLVSAALFGVSVFNFISQSLLNYAVKYCRPGPVLLVRSLNVPGSFLLGFLFLHESPTWWETFGVFLVLSSVSYIAFTRD